MSSSRFNRILSFGDKMKLYIASAIFLFGLIIGPADLCRIPPCASVEIYYSSLSPASIEFFQNQLKPYYDQFKDYLVVTLVPYGQTTRSTDECGKTTFRCENGPLDCKANKAQACALHVIDENSSHRSKQHDSVDLVNCVMTSGRPASAIHQCMKEMGFSKLVKKRIQECIRSSKDDSLLIANGEQTDSLDPPLHYVPSIYINEDYGISQPNEASFDFAKTICDVFKADNVYLYPCESIHEEEISTTPEPKKDNSNSTPETTTRGNPEGEDVNILPCDGTIAQEGSNEVRLNFAFKTVVCDILKKQDVNVHQCAAPIPQEEESAALQPNGVSLNLQFKVMLYDILTKQDENISPCVTDIPQTTESPTTTPKDDDNYDDTTDIESETLPTDDPCVDYEVAY